jgi:hypothetical protein
MVRGSFQKHLRVVFCALFTSPQFQCLMAQAQFSSVGQEMQGIVCSSVRCGEGDLAVFDVFDAVVFGSSWRRATTERTNIILLTFRSSKNTPSFLPIVHYIDKAYPPCFRLQVLRGGCVGALLMSSFFPIAIAMNPYPTIYSVRCSPHRVAPRPTIAAITIRVCLRARRVASERD